MIKRDDLVNRDLSPSESRAAFEQAFARLDDRARNAQLLERAGAVTVSCSWCHASVALVRPHQLCECGHRADVPRAECNCAACTMGRRA